MGGLLGAVVVGALFGRWIGLAWGSGAIVGAIAGLIGPLGDLFESGLKRELVIKDFGNLMPGPRAASSIVSIVLCSRRRWRIFI